MAKIANKKEVAKIVSQITECLEDLHPNLSTRDALLVEVKKVQTAKADRKATTVTKRPLSMSPRAIRERDSIDRARTESRCLDCREETSFRADKADEYYMVHDAIWLRVHPKDDGKLCVGCLERRLGRMLTRADFTAAPVNEIHRGQSTRLRSRLTA